MMGKRVRAVVAAFVLVALTGAPGPASVNGWKHGAVPYRSLALQRLCDLERARARGDVSRIDVLTAAILRTNASLDLATVLQEVVDSACALTGARYGVIATIDEAGEMREFVTSGSTSDVWRQFLKT